MDYFDPTGDSLVLPLDLTSTSVTVTVDIVDDLESENTESFDIGMTAGSALSNTVLGNFRPATSVLIQDNGKFIL